MNRIVLFFLLTIILNIPANSQDPDSLIINRIFSNALTDYTSFNNLKYLCEKAPGRLAGTQASISAVNYCKKVLESYELDTVFLQKIKVQKWDCSSEPTLAIIEKNKKNRKLNICALGPSVATGKEGVVAEAIEVKDLKDLEKLGKKKIKGKIVFFNRPMDNSLFSTGKAYGGAIDQRIHGASEASKYGAAASILRSLTTSIDDFPHTGVFRYEEGIKKIPAVAVSTKDAELLSKKLKKNPKLQLKLNVTCKDHGPVESCNLIGDLKGKKKPEEIILIGAHIDCWHNTPGAHDDGAGCVHMIDVIRIFKELKIKPNRTIRIVLFMDEEMNQSGGKEYAALTEKTKLNHYTAFESDGGGPSPRGFSICASDSTMKSIIRFKKYFEPYHITLFNEGRGGVDIRKLNEFGTPLIGPILDVQRYFDYHHSENDTFDKINHRELQLGAAAIASMIYLIDKHGIKR